jgi:hypothetical protein
MCHGVGARIGVHQRDHAIEAPDFGERGIKRRRIKAMLRHQLGLECRDLGPISKTCAAAGETTRH